VTGGGAVFLAAALTAVFCAGCDTGPSAPPPVHAVDPALQAIRPVPTVKIKVSRSVSGKYSWSLTGTDVKAITEADEELKKALTDGR